MTIFNINAFNGETDISKGRPFIDKSGRSAIFNRKGEKVYINAPATLRYDEWKDIDRAVIAVASERLVAVGDLISKGLTRNLGSIGQTISQWDRSSDMTPAKITMDGGNLAENDTVNFTTSGVPVPVVSKPFQLNMRRLAASRTFGESIDTIQAEIAARVVGEATEDMLLNGVSTIALEGYVIYGYTNHPDRNTVDLTKVWTDGTKTGPEILADVQGMLAAARADLHFGPFSLYIPGEYEGKLDDDYDPGSGDTRTIRERLMMLNGISEIRVLDRLANNNVLLIEMKKEVVDLAVGQDVATLHWQANGGLQEHFNVMAIWAPRVKSDYDGRSGIVHLYEIP